MWPFDYDPIGYLLILGGLAVVSVIWTVIQSVVNTLRCRLHGHYLFRPMTTVLGDTVYHDRQCAICGEVAFAKSD